MNVTHKKLQQFDINQLKVENKNDITNCLNYIINRLLLNGQNSKITDVIDALTVLREAYKKSLY